MSRTHDYYGSHRHWGHDYTFTPVDGGLRGTVVGFGSGVAAGDFLVLENGPKETTRYKVLEIRFYGDPVDMWRAEVEFAPRGKG